MRDKDTIIPPPIGYTESFEDRFRCALSYTHFLSHAMSANPETMEPAMSCRQILDYTDGVTADELERHTQAIYDSVLSQARNYAESEKLRTLEVVSRHFIQDKDFELITPQQYAKQHGLDGSYRPRLREAFYTVTDAAKQAIVDEIRQDDTPSLLEFPVEKEAMGLAIAVTIDKNLDRVQEASETLRQKTSMVQEVKLSREEQLDYSGDKIYMGKLLLKKITDETEIAERAHNLQNLHSALSDYRNSYNETGSHIAAHYNPILHTYVHTELMGHYIALVQSARDQLSHDLLEAYDRIARQGARYTPPKKMTSESCVVDKNAPELTHSVETSQNEITELDIIESPFPWCEDEIEVFLHTGLENSILFCEALSDSARKISDKLRKKTPMNAKSFNRMRDQICKIELSDPIGKKPYIETINDVRNPDFADATVVYFGNSSPNAKRIYYVKTNCAQYPEFTDIALRNGMSEDTPVVVLIAETDKANQIRTYAQEFGMSRSHSKAKNVGAV